MKWFQVILGTACCWLLVIFNASATTHYVDLNCATPTPPYITWSTAATNIQDAIDSSSDGDLILVSNGVYQVGGKTMGGSLTNRVALNKAVTVQSVNGPWVTTILGSHTGSNTPNAVRCAWLTNNAALIGFTLKWGATQPYNGYTDGGGVWCASSNATVANCVIVSNTAAQYGGGAYQGTLKNCLISSNTVNVVGGGACNAVLVNCTVINNEICGIFGLSPGMARATNCILYFNKSFNYQIFNYGGNVSLSHCCTFPAVAGVGNFTNAPDLFVDNVHLNSSSPCIGAGAAVATGTDIFGNAWANPPSVGCAEWEPSPYVTIPHIQLTGDPVGFTIGQVDVAGLSPFSYRWLKDGMTLTNNRYFSNTQTAELVADEVTLGDAGNYQLIVSNAYGAVTSAVVRVTAHCVNAAGKNPIPPYSSWATAATNIQDAISVAAAGDIVLVTNGLYATGGQSMDGIITNRVSVAKAILVQSVNGPAVTVIQGAWDPTSTNGPAAVRCVWMTNNAVLSGFTLERGATRSVTLSPNPSMSGGGVFGTSNTAEVCNCVLATNYAANLGGGAFSVTLNHCTLIGNHALGSGTAGAASAGSGGGAANSNLKNCAITSNFADQSDGGGALDCHLINCALTHNSSEMDGGAAKGGTLVNCTATANIASSTYNSSFGAAVYGASLTNCIVLDNLSRTSYPNTNYASCTLDHCCADPQAAGNGNLDVDPQLLPDDIHLAATSPCIGAGDAAVVSGTDIDGQPWNLPPAIGCDEWHPTPVMAVQPAYQVDSPAHGLTFRTAVAGQTPLTYIWRKDGTPIQNPIIDTNSSTANLTINHFGPADAGSYQVVVSNSFGVVTSKVAQVVIHAVNATSTTPAAPYSTWATAANNIQDAINAAAPGDIVLVTNGTYATGGLAMAGNLINRVALNKAITVISVNGYKNTIISGAWDPGTTNGPQAVRCAWIGAGAVLNGFTLEDGATRATGDYPGGPLESGGGVWCDATNATVSCCLLTNNSAIYGGGMAYGELENSLIIGNYATEYGGGTYSANLNNCTVVGNVIHTSPKVSGAGTYNGSVKNCIVVNNNDDYGPLGFLTLDNYAGSFGQAFYDYSCTASSPTSSSRITGTGNIYVDPEFLDDFHISSLSPCRGAGNPAYASGHDLDGEPWQNSPSMGCDEVISSNLTGPLSVKIAVYTLQPLVNRSLIFSGGVTGRAAYIKWNFGDGTVITNAGSIIAHRWTNAGDYRVTFTAFNNDHPAGVSTNVLMQVQPLNPPQLQSETLSGGGFQFQFTGQVGANYVVQYTTNLAPPVSWQTLQTIYYSSGGSIQIKDSAPSQNRFYRVLVQ